MVIALIAIKIFYPNLDKEYKPFERPNKIGELNGIEIYTYIGDIVIPNKIDSNNIINQDLTFWDSYIITAPVPYYQGNFSIIPWTMLPLNVVQTIEQYDTIYSRTLEKKLSFDKPLKERKFNSFTPIKIPDNTIYGILTKLNTIYAINLFEFEKDFGKDYRNSLKNAISNSIKYSIEYLGREQEISTAIPALAGAKNVIDKELTIEYQDSFSSILSGISRAKGNTPSKVILVVYYGLHSKNEFKSAMNGLEKSLIDIMPKWKKQIKIIYTALFYLSYILGLILYHGIKKITHTDSRKIIIQLEISIVILGLTFISSDFIKGFLEILTKNKNPYIILSLFSILIFNLVYYLCIIGIIQIEKSD